MSLSIPGVLGVRCGVRKHRCRGGLELKNTHHRLKVPSRLCGGSFFDFCRFLLQNARAWHRSRHLFVGKTQNTATYVGGKRESVSGGEVAGEGSKKTPRNVNITRELTTNQTTSNLTLRTGCCRCSFVGIARASLIARLQSPKILKIHGPGHKERWSHQKIRRKKNTTHTHAGKQKTTDT